MDGTTIVKNYIRQWDPPNGRRLCQAIRWPLNSYRARPVKGNYHLWIPLGRFVQYQYAPTIHEVLMGAALRQQASDAKKKERKRAKKKTLGTECPSVNQTNKQTVPRLPLDPKEINTIPFPTGESSRIIYSTPTREFGNYFWADSVMQRRVEREQQSAGRVQGGN